MADPTTPTPPAPAAPPPEGAEPKSEPLQLFNRAPAKAKAKRGGLSPAEAKFFETGGDLDPSLAGEPKPEGEKPPEGTAAPATPDAQKPPEGAKPPEPKPPESPAKPPDGYVPLSVLMEERRRYQEMVQAEARRRQEIEDAIRQAQQQPAVPDPQEDPVGYLQAQNMALQQQLLAVAQQQQALAEQQQAEQVKGALLQRIMASGAQYRQKAPDYPQAWQHLVAERDKQLAPLIPDPAAREQQILSEAMQLAAQSLQQGVEPAERFYALAKAWGYGGTPPPAAPSGTPPPSPETAEAMRKIQEGLRHQSPNGGSPPPQEVTAQDVLSERDPAKFQEKWEKLFGR